MAVKYLVLDENQRAAVDAVISDCGYRQVTRETTTTGQFAVLATIQEPQYTHYVVACPWLLDLTPTTDVEVLPDPEVPA